MAAEIESLTFVDRLCGGTLGVDRHSADWVFFRCFYVLVHRVRHVEGLDSSLRYRTLARIDSQVLALAVAEKQPESDKRYG